LKEAGVSLCPNVKEYLWGQFADDGKPNRPFPPEFQADMAEEHCRICDRLFGAHSDTEFDACMAEIFIDGKRPPEWPEIVALGKSKE
jgi:hypothetical protein